MRYERLSTTHCVEPNKPLHKNLQQVSTTNKAICKMRDKAPHIHVRYQDEEIVLGIPDGIILSGKLSPAKLKLVQAWIEIHRDELMADWQLAANGQEVFEIEPLK